MSAIINYTILPTGSVQSVGNFVRLEQVREFLYTFSLKERYKFNDAVVVGAAVRWPFPQPIRRIRIHPFTGRVVLERYWK